MKKAILVIALLSAPLFAQTYSRDVLPSTTGYKLGSTSQRWDAFIRNLNVTGPFTMTDPAAFFGTAAGYKVNGTTVIDKDRKATFSSVNGVINAAIATGGDIGAKINTLAQSLCSAAGYSDPVKDIPYSFSAGTIQVPPGSYTYSTPVVLPCPMIIEQTGAKFNYTGTGTALTLGPSGLSETGVTPIHEGWYIVRGGMFTGGQAAIHAILINKGVVNTITDHVKYHNFGTAGNPAEYVSGNNWVVRSVGDDFQNDGPTLGGSWFESFPDTNTQIHIVNNFYRGGGGSNFGAKITGVGSSISHSQGMSGGSPNLSIVRYGNGVDVDDVYMECSSGCIQYGPAGTTAEKITGLTVQNSYFNLHNAGNVLFTTNSNSGLQGARFIGNRVSGMPEGGTLINQTTVGGQTDNEAFGNVLFAYNDFTQVSDATGKIHDHAGTVANWKGSQGDHFLLGNASWLSWYDAAGVVRSNIQLGVDGIFRVQGHPTTKHITLQADPAGTVDFDIAPGAMNLNGHLWVNGYLDVQTGTSLRGYSDTGSNKTFEVNSSTGAATFNGGLSTNTTATGTTCTVGGYVTLIVDGATRKIAYCN
jgi:hypothetical protein